MLFGKGPFLVREGPSPACPSHQQQEAWETAQT